MASRSSRNLIWPLYGIVIGVAFILSTTAGVVVAIAGVLVAGLAVVPPAKPTRALEPLTLHYEPDPAT